MGEARELKEKLSKDDQDFVNSLEDVSFSSAELKHQEKDGIAELRSEFEEFKVKMLGGTN